MDAIHLASALFAKSDDPSSFAFGTRNRRLAAAAEAEGLEVFA